jgi:5-methylcytosine-specific restriction endonuclease McrA
MPRKLRQLPPRIGQLDTRRVKPPPKRADPELLSAEWRELRARIIAERGYRCEECGRSDGRLFLDHVVERADGGALLPGRDGLRLLCGTHHQLKTAAVRRDRAREVYR